MLLKSCCYDLKVNLTELQSTLAAPWLRPLGLTDADAALACEAAGVTGGVRKHLRLHLPCLQLTPRFPVSKPLGRHPTAKLGFYLCFYKTVWQHIRAPPVYLSILSVSRRRRQVEASFVSVMILCRKKSLFNANESLLDLIQSPRRRSSSSSSSSSSSLPRSFWPFGIFIITT